MSRAKKLKRQAQRIHFQRRAKERLGYEIPPSEVKRIKREIQSGTGQLLTRPNRRLSLWRVKVGKREGFVAVYDADTEELVTLMTDSVWQKQHMCNSPYVDDGIQLKGTLSEHRGAEELLELRKKLGGE